MASETQIAVQLVRVDAEHPEQAIEAPRRIPIPEPARGEVLIKLICRPVNPADVLCLPGLYSQMNSDFLTVPGNEGVGVVDATGPGAYMFRKGARVIGVPFSLDQKNGAASH